MGVTDDKMMYPTTPKNPTPSEVGHAYWQDASDLELEWVKTATYGSTPFNEECAGGLVLRRQLCY